MLNKLKIRTTLMLVVVILLTVLMDFIVGNTILKNKLYHAFEKEAFTVIKALDNHINYMCNMDKFIGQKTDYDSLCDSALESYEKLEYILAVNDQGEILFGSGNVYRDMLLHESTVRDQFEEKYTGTFQLEYGGIRYLSFVHPVYNENQHDIAAIVIGYKEESVMGPIYLTSKISLILSLAIATISILVIAALINRWITNPLKRLNKATQHIGFYGAEGMKPIRIESKTEIGDLGKQYNLMLERLQNSMVSKAYLDNIITNISDALFVVNISRKIQKANASALSLLGYEKEELIGSSICSLFEATVDVEADCIEKISKTGKLRNLETKMITKDGKVFPVLLCCSVMENKRTGSKEIILSAKDITERKIMQDAIAYRANHDMLTGLSNRYALSYALEQVFELLEEDENQQHVFLFMDLDNLKIINDACGHKAGDELIKQLTQIIKENLRDFDILTRLGGDEFGALLLNVTMETGVMIGTRICEAISKHRFHWKNQCFKCGISIGAATIDKDNRNPDQIVMSADKACYISKANGGGFVTIADSLTASDKADKESMENNIKDAIVKRKLYVEYQQMVYFKKTDQKYYTAVLHMANDNGKSVNPSFFYPEIRRKHLCEAVDRWMFEKICEEYHPLKQKIGNVCVSMNITKESLESKTFSGFILDKLAEYNVPKEAVCLEIEEALISTYYSCVSEFIRKLSKEGIHFGINGFGTGLSGYRYLDQLNAEYFKIDESFTQGITENELDKAYVSSIVSLAQLMKKQTIAGQIESKEQFEQAKKLGINGAQGSYIGTSKILEAF